MSHFAITGVSGFVGPRHLEAIKSSGNNLIAAMDTNDSIISLKPYFSDVQFFHDSETFFQFLQHLNKSSAVPIDYVSICSPNHHHEEQIRRALECDAHVICEKPLVLDPRLLDDFAKLEQSSGKSIWSVLQLRLHPAMIALKQRIESERASKAKKYRINLKYLTARGDWYHKSWKGDETKSGGILTNIGIHFFDLLLWLFGPADSHILFDRNHERASGQLSLQNADVDWELSIRSEDIPEKKKLQGNSTFRALIIDGEEIDLDVGNSGLHTKLYEETLAGRGFGLEDVYPSIKLVYDLRHAKVQSAAFI